MDNHSYHYSSSAHSVECLLAAGAAETLTASAGTAFDQLRKWADVHQDWLFGHLAYDLARETEPSHSGGPGADPATTGSAGAPPPDGPDPIGFPDLLFFVPEILVELNGDNVRIGSFGTNQEAIWQQIRQAPPRGVPAEKEAERRLHTGGAAGQPAGSILPTGSHPHTNSHPPMGTAPRTGSQSDTAGTAPAFESRFTRSEYLATVSVLQDHILRGDCYEINFCQEFYSRDAVIDPLSAWFSLSAASPNPFAAFYRVGPSNLLCASPERFLKKTKDTLISQPIKGTAPRIPQDPEADLRQHDWLYNSPKDRSENVMVVDLVRNDMSRVCVPGSVMVDELFGIYPFPQVHQMISSVTGQLLPGTDWTEAIRACFPMGSMTGAPKNRVVELIERYERSRRGIFSGAVGYVTPNRDFDFNVVIRSLMYNSDTRYLSYQVGSGITFYSDPAAEYEECLVKARGLRKALEE
ncbi:anthranilate synthase component I family protein [Puia sp. P3]|uniref:anthranilate synthase component I family protein n=1 Tax=Puia sp. P3 TaxID=3423952 RepID=UPI003D6689CA